MVVSIHTLSSSAATGSASLGFLVLSSISDASHSALLLVSRARAVACAEPKARLACSLLSWAAVSACSAAARAACCTEGGMRTHAPESESKLQACVARCGQDKTAGTGSSVASTAYNSVQPEWLLIPAAMFSR